MSPQSSRPASSLAAARGTLQLGVAGTLAVTRLAEAVHMAVLSTTPLFLGKHLTRGVYAGVRVAAGAVGQGGDSLLRFVERQVNPGGDSGTSIPMALPLDIQAVLNGIVGDRLVEMNHSARFWAVVESLMPDYKEPHKLLSKMNPSEVPVL